jgi:hypothetical protein
VGDGEHVLLIGASGKPEDAKAEDWTNMMKNSEWKWR